MAKVLDINKKLLHIKYSEPLQLQIPNSCQYLIDEIRLYHNPDVVIFDPIYFAFTGSLSEDASVRRFLGNIRRMKQEFDCVIILVHHTHKPKHDNFGNIIAERDEALFGSKFLKAWADSTIVLTWNKKSLIRTYPRSIANRVYDWSRF